MQFKSVFWVWLNATSAASLVGDKSISGGALHVAFREPTGQQVAQVAQFFAGTRVQKVGSQWTFGVEAYGDIAARDLFIWQNAKNLQRQEFRIPRQSPRSQNAYPLWTRLAVRIARQSQPIQVIVILRDTADHFHVRLLGVGDMGRFSPSVARRILAARSDGQVHLYVGRGSFDDLPCPPPTQQSLRVEEGTSGSVVGDVPAAQPKPPGDTDWARVLNFVRRVDDRPRVRKIQQIERRLRDREVRSAALLCFGERCQARGCPFTATLPPELMTYVLEVHHVKGVARGGSDLPINLTVLCANHHRLAELAPNAKAVEVPGTDDVLITYEGGAFLIERDLTPLRDQLEKERQA